MEMKETKAKFIEIYGAGGDIRVFHSPGRVNLIGEHTDYNGGYVFPCALNFGTYGIARARKDNQVHFATTNFDTRFTVDLNHIIYEKDHDWANYPKGILKGFLDRGMSLGGMDLLFSGNIPNGAGLSSSASLEMLMGVILNGLFGCGMDTMDMVKLSQQSENHFIGVNCGIMDMFAVGMGKKGFATLLNCQNLDYQYVPLQLSGYRIVIANTNKRRGLADSKYNERRSQCEAAAADLKAKLAITCLGEVSIEDFEANKGLIRNEIDRKRAEHVVYEDYRALTAVGCLEKGNLEEFGKLLVQSHESLRDLYEVTGAELDALMEEAVKMPGCLGSRMTGAGFGGCTVSLVKESGLEEFIQTVGENYEKRTGLKADFYIGETGDGAGEVL